MYGTKYLRKKCIYKVNDVELTTGCLVHTGAPVKLSDFLEVLFCCIKMTRGLNYLYFLVDLIRFPRITNVLKTLNKKKHIVFFVFKGKLFDFSYANIHKYDNKRT